MELSSEILGSRYDINVFTVLLKILFSGGYRPHFKEILSDCFFVRASELDSIWLLEANGPDLALFYCQSVRASQRLVVRGEPPGASTFLLSEANRLELAPSFCCQSVRASQHFVFRGKRPGASTFFCPLHS